MISSGAQKEADRLKSQAIVIEPTRLTPAVTNMITAIDGAVLVDPSSICYAIGVILDGPATEKGDPSRGARYNSAIRYVEVSSHCCLVIVVSEDGSVDMVPNLMPQIPRSAIIEAIQKLSELNKEEKFDSKTFYNTLDWLYRHRFYLLPEMCVEINRLRREIEALRDRIDAPTFTPIYSDLTPNEDMNCSYFIEEPDQSA